MKNSFNLTRTQTIVVTLVKNPYAIAALIFGILTAATLLIAPHVHHDIWG